MEHTQYKNFNKSNSYNKTHFKFPNNNTKNPPKPKGTNFKAIASNISVFPSTEIASQQVSAVTMNDKIKVQNFKPEEAAKVHRKEKKK